MAAPTRSEVLRLAWPIVLANSAAPLLGLVDTAVIGNTGSAADLGAIALGALILSFVYWSFGFLRMGTTGFTAQASGAGDSAEIRATLARALLLGGAIGVGLVALQQPIAWAAVRLLGASHETEALARAYFDIRIWGAPATLATYALLGSLVGLGRTREVLVVQLLLNGLNIGLDLLFAGHFGWGVRGIALGTAIAEWSAGAAAFLIVRRYLREIHGDDEPFWPWPRIRDRGPAIQTLTANADILVRTLFLLLGFAWFTNYGARFGNATLAANHILLQLVGTSAYLLDGYAHATELLIGRAIGARDRVALDATTRSAAELAGASALALSGLLFFAGSHAVNLLTDLEEVRVLANRYLPFTAAYVLVSFPAFQLDGIFIGATRTRDMRNASVLSLLAFVGLSTLLAQQSGNAGLWSAFIAYVVLRAVTLAYRYPVLRRDLTPRGRAS